MKKPTIVPFVKWVGGKRQLLPDIEKIMLKMGQINKYHEPFVGGGALLFEKLKDVNTKVGSINDMNSDLINCYKVIKEKPHELMKTMKQLEKSHSRMLFYFIRFMDRIDELEKKSDVFKAARFIYLNKTGFNGLYRVNGNNQFNVPIGALGKVKIYSEENILNISKAQRDQDIEIYNGDYSYILQVAEKGDIVYFDPPYDAFEDKNNFVQYQKDGFNRENQKELKQTCDELISKGIKVIVSNHNTNFIRELYKDKKYYVHVPVMANRMLNSNAKKRGKENIEIIIYGGYDE